MLRPDGKSVTTKQLGLDLHRGIHAHLGTDPGCLAPQGRGDPQGSVLAGAGQKVLKHVPNGEVQVPNLRTSIFALPKE